MPKPTRLELEQQLSRLQSENFALKCMVLDERTQPEEPHHYQHQDEQSGDSYLWLGYRLDRHDGGFALGLWLSGEVPSQGYRVHYAGCVEALGNITPTLNRINGAGSARESFRMVTAQHVSQYTPTP